MLTYEKGAAVLRMLRWLLGDNIFFNAISSYATNHVFELTNNFVDVSVLRAEMESASNLDLGGFFEQWVYSTGYPKYLWAAEFTENQGDYEATVQIEQVQAGPVYDLPIAVWITQGQDTEPQKARLEFDHKIARHTFVLDRKPLKVLVDPEEWIWGEKTPLLRGDINRSNQVDGIDLIYMAWAQGGNIFNYAEAYNYYLEADLDRDGKVAKNDLNHLLAQFGQKGEVPHE